MVRVRKTREHKAPLFAILALDPHLAALGQRLDDVLVDLVHIGPAVWIVECLIRVVEAMRRVVAKLVFDGLVCVLLPHRGDDVDELLLAYAPMVWMQALRTEEVFGAHLLVEVAVPELTGERLVAHSQPR